MMLDTHCPHCGLGNGLHAAADGGTDIPADGDLSLCSACLQPGIYVNGPAGFSVRLPTGEELAEILGSDDYQACVTLLRRLKTGSGAHPEG